MSSPHGVAKFADPTDKQSPQRLTILLALTDAEDLGTRKAAAGAIAGLVEWGEQVAVAVVDSEKGIERCLGTVEDEEEDVRWRGLVAVRCLLEVKGAREKVLEKGGLERVRDAVRKTRQPGILEVGVEVLKMLM